MRKRSSYRPKQVDADPLNMRRKQEADRVMGSFYTALEEITKGKHPGIEEWRSLSDAVNLVETMAKCTRDLLPEEVLPDVKTATEGMAAAGIRFMDGKGMRLDAASLQALREVVGIYGHCLAVMKKHHLENVTRVTAKRVQKILRNSPSGAVVVSL